MRYVCPAAILVALVGVAPIALNAQGLSITNYQLVNQQAATAGEWDLTYSAVVVNSGPALGSVAATLTSTNPFSLRALPGTSTLNFGPVPANGQVASSNTFTVMASSATLDPTQIQWTFQTTPAGPIANAGPNQTATVGSTVTLNGSASTTPSGILSYKWTFSSRPAGTSTILINATSVMPSFVVDVAGTYVVTLTVSNGNQASAANVIISTTSTPPVANVGPNQTVAVGATALLNGSGSSDVDGNPLTFSWTMTNRPTGSTASLVGATTITPSFVVDKAGSYTVQLIVKDASLSSAPSSVTITSENSPPVANAGTGQVVTVGSTVQLDGSGSTDTDGDALTYQWSLITVPAGSTAKLNSSTAVKPTFTADRAGTYVAQLIVKDGITDSNPATVTITTIAVLPPTANAGSNQTVSAGTVVSLNGSGTDPQKLQLTFHWSLTTLPANSKATLSSATIANPSFSADLPGTYIAQLQVNNGTMNSNPATVTITATAPSGLQVPANTVVAPGQTMPLNVTLGSPAPAGGLFVSLASSNPSTATVAAAFMIPGGATAPVTTPKVNGVAFGSATITATAVGFPQVTGAVQVTETLSFSPASLAITGLTKGQLYLFIPEAAPSSGVTLNVSSSNPSVATVPSTVVIGPGATNVNVPVTGVSYGSTAIQASGANIAVTTASVTVSAPVATGPPTIAGVSGGNQSTQVSTAFAAPLVVVVKDSNSNPIRGATVTFSTPSSSASGAFGGGVTTAATNASGIATSAAFSANGTAGSYYVAASVSGAVTPAAFFLTNVSAAPSGSTAPAPSATIQPGTPTSFRCSVGTGPGSDTIVSLTWNRADDTDASIVLSRATSVSGTYTPTTLTAHSNIFNDTNAYPGTTYYYKVHASNGGGSSADAGPINCTTIASQANFTAAGSFAVVNTDPWTNTLTWTDSNTVFRYWQVQYSLDGVWFQTVNPLLGATAATGFVHPSLTPATKYWYRVRVTDSSSKYSDWTPPASVTTAARPAGVPLELTNFTCVVNSATSTQCTWTNSGGAGVKIETSAYNNGAPSFSQVVQTPAGATSYTLTTTAETFYYVRARPSNASGNGGYTPVVKIRTASAGSGSPRTYTIDQSGAGGAYTSIGASPIVSGLGPGDVVNIHAGIYHEKFIMSNRGTAAAHITVNCAAGAIIDGTNAVSLAASEQIGNGANFQDLFLVAMSRRSSQSSAGAWSPGYIDFNGCELRNAVNGQTYTSSTGTRTYSTTGCMYIYDGDHITLASNTIHGCSDGIFSAGNNDTRNVENIQVGVCPSGNYIYGNGAVGSATVHNAYQEGINMIYECNKFGDLVAGASATAVAGIKDRSAGLIVRYNKFATAIQENAWVMMGSPQNYATFTVVNPLFNSIQIYGNDFEDLSGPCGTQPNCSSSPALLSSWGNDQGSSSYSGAYRTGPHYFYDNDITLQSNRPTVRYFTLFGPETPVSTIDVRNNVIWNGAVSGSTAGHVYLMNYWAGNMDYFGSNWISSGYYNCSEYQTCRGILGGGSAIVNNGSTNNPGFTTIPESATFNLSLTSSGQALGHGGVLGGNWGAVTEQYVEPNGGQARTNINDLGAYQ